jgi:aldehyde:ferredoxin oxidoreductase
VLSGRSISALRRYGAVITGNGGIDGSLPQPVRNLQDGYWSPEKTLKLSALVFKEVYEGHRVASLGCPIGCGRVYNFASGGENVQFQGLQANAVSNYGPFLDCDDPIKILEATFSANELGLDWDGSSAAIAWAFEAFERGILTLEDTDGLELRWGNGSATVELLHKMALRQGIGALLADGPLFATKRINCGLEFAMHVKGAPLRETWLQIDPMWSLGIAVATRGSGHLNGAIKLRVLQSAPDTVKDEMRRFGLNVTFPNPSPEEIASAVAWFENYKSVVDSLGLCYFTSWWADPLALGPDDYADLMSAATGISSTGSSILEQGNRIHNVEKAFNTLHAGLDRQNDYLPDRLYSNEISAGPDKGAKLDRKQFEDLLDHYYAHREYDIRNGWQTPDSLKKLGLSQIAERLCDAGRLGHMN